ncbi:hypothetical protein [Stappia sp.]|uniref:hypothetical protein n=1 Tax=Stappia sp. TaxID=1870903 RepID=UPI003D117F57
MRSGRAGWGMAVLACAALTLVPGCRDEEQNRALHTEKGVYQGTPDETLSEADRRELQNRAGSQRF